MVWSRPSDSGTVPVPRAGLASCVVGSRLFVFGGGDSEEVFNDLHVLDTAFLKVDVSARQRRKSQTIDTSSPKFKHGCAPYSCPAITD